MTSTSTGRKRNRVPPCVGCTPKNVSKASYTTCVQAGHSPCAAVPHRKGLVNEATQEGDDIISRSSSLRVFGVGRSIADDGDDRPQGWIEDMKLQSMSYR